MTEVANSAQIGTTTISVETLLSKEQELAALRDAKNAADALVAAKDQIIENLEQEVANTQKVVVYSDGGYCRSRKIIETTNLDSLLRVVKEEAKKEIEESVGEELVTLRAAQKDYQKRTDQINVEHDQEIDRLQQKVDEKYNEGKKLSEKRLKAVEEGVSELTAAYEANVAKLAKEKELLTTQFADQVAELNLQLQDKSEAQKLAKQISVYKETIAKLTDAVNASWINRLYNHVTGRTSKSFEKINNLLRSLVIDSPDPLAVKTVVPSFLNKYAAAKIYREGSVEEVDVKRVQVGVDYWGDPNYKHIGKKIQWIAVEV